MRYQREKRCLGVPVVAMVAVTFILSSMCYYLVDNTFFIVPDEHTLLFIIKSSKIQQLLLEAQLLKVSLLSNTTVFAPEHGGCLEIK